MARSMWSGSISFGLVNVPVKLYTAVSPKDVRFHQLEDGTGARIRQKRVSAETGEEVPYERIVKAYEIGPDRYVVITLRSSKALTPRRPTPSTSRTSSTWTISTPSTTSGPTTWCPTREAPRRTSCCWRPCGRPTRWGSPGW